MRVYELAKELGLEPAVVMSRLDYLGESVLSISSTLSPRVVDKVRESFANLRTGTPSTGDRSAHLAQSRGHHVSAARDGAVRSSRWPG